MKKPSMVYILNPYFEPRFYCKMPRRPIVLFHIYILLRIINANVNIDYISKRINIWQWDHNKRHFIKTFFRFFSYPFWKIFRLFLFT